MAKIDRAALLQRIREIDGLSNDERSALIELLNTHKKYGLVWENKPEDVEERLREELPVLVEDVSKRIINDTADEKFPNHILIEGDNLEALTALSYTHEGKIDVIYIDPPYNTGNKDFVYNDSYVDKEDAYRHSKWLSFMSKRLQIAKRLLSDKGVIFISIDDNEQANLELLCNEIIGEKNRIAILPRITKSSGKTTDKIAQNHDYIFFYAKKIEDAIVSGVPHNDKGFKYSDEYEKERGKYKLNQTLDYDSLSYSDSLDYPITIEGNTLYPGGSYEKYLERKSGNHRRADWTWRWSRDLYDFGVKNGFVVLKKSKNGMRIYTKTYQHASIIDNGTQYIIEYQDRTKPIQSINFIDNRYSNDNAKKELAKIFDSIPFDYPKPTTIMDTALQILPKSIIILDFFAGSGTTLHATMQLNTEDGGHRQCILVTNNENNICEEVTYERNKRVIQGYTTPKGEQVEGLHGNNLRYFRTDFISRERTNQNMRKLVSLATDMLCIKENIYDEQKTFGTLKLKPSVVRHFVSGNRQMLIIYNEDAIERLVKEIDTLQVCSPIKIYLFAPGRYAFDDSFEIVAEKVSLCALPAAIYDAYQKVLPKKRDKLLPEFETMSAPTESEQTINYNEEDKQ